MSTNKIFLHKIINNNICEITLNNPLKRNPLSLELITSLQALFHKLKKSKMVKVVILKSTGPSFCSGHDLNEVRKLSKSKVRLLNLFKKCSQMMMTVRELPQPVIACVDGLAAAAGCQLVASCDLVIATKESTFQTPGVNIGLFCSTPMVAISRKVAPKDMMYMLLTGDQITAKEAKEYKLINIITNKKQFQKQIDIITNKLQKKSFQSIKIGKVAFYNQLEMDLGKAYNYTSQVMTKNMQVKDAKEGIEAFVKKRTPNWTK
ncbi:MAG: Enoyl-CoA-hydratase [Alphaproteobacteria bacterium MarineAlpha9_Bin4]|nr:enoyl-CoA hydratase [Pelagibacterales bacterium]PPR25210.1 MAG: Enoyl-CoA-hydratase [Alphaproteobacteria bacterium MarineAlpha9_Bin4]|tara:strand:+ start:2415 stop:3200 length:786 start_codon:yes stop_codon:yes gene_type:complete